MTKFLAVGLVMIGLGGFLAGCASLGTSAQARTSLVNVRPAAASTIFETAVELTLRVTNETNRPLELSGSSHKLSLNGASVGRGVSDVPVSVAPLGTATFSVTVYLENLTLLRKFSDVQNLREVNYRIESRLLTGGRTLPAVTEGAFDLRPFMSAMPR